MMNALLWIALLAGFNAPTFAHPDRFTPPLLLQQGPPQVPEGNGQCDQSPELFASGETDEQGEVFLHGQAEQHNKIIFTASNGFFDSGTCIASGQSTLPKVGDEMFIKPNYALLSKWKKVGGEIRWHVWIEKPGAVFFQVNMQVAANEGGSRITASFGNQKRELSTIASEVVTAQPWALTFQVEHPGEHVFTLTANHIANKKNGVGMLHTIDVFGPGIKGAKLLRARWRPAAVHGSYKSSKIKESLTWVMTTESSQAFSSYSPITTPFGYFGTSFDADRRSNGALNFSMWAASKKADLPPLEQMPHLLAAGSPTAEFSGFGHEGSGVKLRGWVPMPDRPKICTLALRVENDGNYHTYFGYFFDYGSSAWKLYAVGRKWNGGKQRLHLQPGSFCEVPGPPHVQRSGDQVREVRRRGWHLDEKGKWHSMDTFVFKPKGAENKYWTTTAEGEFVMGTGGIRFYRNKPTDPTDPTDPTEATLAETIPLPNFLSPEATQQLTHLPAEFGDMNTISVGRTKAVLNVAMKRIGDQASAEIFFGEVDCLSFAKRMLHGTERNSDVSQASQSEGRSWSFQQEISSLKDGPNRVTLRDLQPDTNYYYRVLVKNTEGQLWTLETHHFKTRR